MEFNLEAIIALVALVVTLPPTLLILCKYFRRRQNARHTANRHDNTLASFQSSTLSRSMDRCSAFGKTLSHDSLDPPNPMAHLLEGSRNIDKVNGKVIRMPRK
ncbi:hypothetical protein CFRS1_v011384 [Colletotrichum fructicola]|nr:hypothetical protein CFRS1_v011384 [Colletotrichum fructicola]